MIIAAKQAHRRRNPRRPTRRSCTPWTSPARTRTTPRRRHSTTRSTRSTTAIRSRLIKATGPSQGCIPTTPEEAGRGAVDGSSAGGFDVDAVMRRAGVDGSVVKGVSAAQLRSGGGDRIRENATTGLAFDDEYRDKLTKDGGHAPSLAHKSKNQIGSLLYNAKQAELKIMEGRLQGVSHKAQARQKYGW